MSRQNPPSAIVASFEAIESALKQYLLRFFVRSQDVEDILQETFLRAWESEQTQTIHSPRSFLFRIARNVALSEIGRKANRLTRTMGDLEELNVLDRRPSVEEELDIHQQLAHLSGIVTSLPPQCRRVLIMRKALGFSHKEIARQLGISPRTVEKHLARGLQRCQESLQQQTGASPAVSTAAGGAGSVAKARGGDE